MEPLTLSRPLSFSDSPSLLQLQGAMDGLRLPPLIEEALDSTGLCSCFVSVCVCLFIRDSVQLAMAIFSPALQIRYDQQEKAERLILSVLRKSVYS